jgi:16S rRNA processing protein RimM
MELLEVGKIGKPHGLHGEVAVDLTTTRTDRLDPGAALVAAPVGGGARTTLVVEQARPHLGRYLVTFVGLSDRTAAQRLTNATLFAEPSESDGELFVHELIGAIVVDAGGIERGPVTAVEANPASDLLVLEDGSLVPMRFVTTFERGVVHIDAPDGLFE